ncbi:MAG: hypothetical protein UW26_C0030G0006 [Candidatus Collierbacteria bacterium GW2011_GWF1_44_12]|uniref:Putative membrane protein insertion efficiency factor n=2 Tax=Candidatus Collieribacteriota TaxID=1752725 RepID=A0A0G1P5T1_9BACT|nr:MAG: hypothetical protein UW26_C0030G0006 [Candidatus Collierbacteria bacterium GW2011_GWF1_44_12]KKU28234.1 MAG: hypothetical protein UX41_C0038G0006 [Candidatus Collierbacteria bacterium GW2011_GWE1_46_18]
MTSFLLSIYKNVISPITHSIGQALFGSTFACRFTPSCSQYTHTSIKRYGIITGLRLSIQRIARCHPFSQGGFDPVPDKIK